MPKKKIAGTKEEKKKPKKAEAVKITGKEYESKVVELAKKGLTSEKIGETLRKEGIHPKDHEKRISKILKDNGAYVDPDLKNLGEKLDNIRAHFDKNKQDKRAMRERDRVYAKIRKLKNYFGIPLK